VLINGNTRWQNLLN
ncbi:hypothetical protein EE612_047021, partial [Oryza sativa]